jgi:pyrroloquinoline quinone biosynthesis protein B
MEETHLPGLMEPTLQFRRLAGQPRHRAARDLRQRKAPSLRAWHKPALGPTVPAERSNGVEKSACHGPAGAIEGGMPSAMRIIVLGAGAGGGFPQWNCNCANCRRARAKDPAARPRTQSSLAVSADEGRSWTLLNASPDLRQQIAENPALHPSAGLRHSPIGSVVLTNADVDHVAGLLTLRESQAFAIHATSRVLGVIGANAIFNVLDPRLVTRERLVLDEKRAVVGPEGRPTGLSVRAFTVPGKVALWLEDPRLADFGSTEEDTVGLEVSAGERRFFYVPGCAAMPPALADRLRGADLVFFDGTTFADDEMIALGLGGKTASRMGHMSLGGEGGTIAAFAPLGVRRKILIHINNSNPVLIDGSPERREVEAEGWEVATDGMEVTL